MATQVVRFFSLLFVGLALAPGLAHVLQLPHKIGLSGPDYLRVQQLYAGWAWLGLVVLGALVSTFALTVLVRRGCGSSRWRAWLSGRCSSRRSSSGRSRFQLTSRRTTGPRCPRTG